MDIEFQENNIIKKIQDFAIKSIKEQKKIKYIALDRNDHNKYLEIKNNSEGNLYLTSIKYKEYEQFDFKNVSFEIIKTTKKTHIIYEKCILEKIKNIIKKTIKEEKKIKTIYLQEEEWKEFISKRKDLTNRKFLIEIIEGDNFSPGYAMSFDVKPKNENIITIQFT